MSDFGKLRSLSFIHCETPISEKSSSLISDPEISLDVKTNNLEHSTLIDSTSVELSNRFSRLTIPLINHGAESLQ